MRSNTNQLSDEGSAIVDLVAFGVMLQIPILMFATLAISHQQNAIAIEAIARHALRSHVLWPDRQNTTLLVQDLALDFGLDASKLEWQIVCKPNPNCLEENSLAEIHVLFDQLSAYAMQRF